MEFRYSAQCDRCGHDQVLYTKGRAEAVHALVDFGWQWVAEGKGSELMCPDCVQRASVDAEERESVGLPPVHGLLKLVRPKFRAAWDPCRECRRFFDYDHLVWNPFKPQRKVYLLCDECAFKLLDARGLRGYVDVPLTMGGGA